ncbi:cyclophilin-like fold protein [Streptomyces sp. NPDC023588]|uniref:cyclophilin-like fold protein n=1 Tax=Streptomyces sp. NPDC023588 TaxID=3154907 RepID=UPI0033E9B885
MQITRRSIDVAGEDYTAAAAAAAAQATDCLGRPAPLPARRSPSSVSDRSTAAMDIRVTLDGRSVGATLNDSPAARDFADLLPLTLHLEDFHGTERVADLPRKLDTSGAPEPAAVDTGDIAYYAPWGNLALFYRDGPAASADLLILGHLDVSADQLGRADRVTLEAAS